MKRKPGFYWVSSKGMGSFVAEWIKGGGWFAPGMVTIFSDSDFIKISELRLEKPF